MNPPRQALIIATHYEQSEHRFPEGFCLGANRTYFAAPYRYGTARDNWLATPRRYRHSGYSVPAGYPMSWLGGHSGFGHIAISCGGEFCLSTDFGPNGYIGDGRVRKVAIARIHQIDPPLIYQGWANWLEGVALALPASAPKPSPKPAPAPEFAFFNPDGSPHNHEQTLAQYDAYGRVMPLGATVKRTK